MARPAPTFSCSVPASASAGQSSRTSTCSSVASPVVTRASFAVATRASAACGHANAASTSAASTNANRLRKMGDDMAVSVYDPR